jgi:hypothetical protein
MRLETGDYRSTDQRSVDDHSTEHSLLTPARRAALDALEREFHDLLQQTRADAA